MTSTHYLVQVVLCTDKHTIFHGLCFSLIWVDYSSGDRVIGASVSEPHTSELNWNFSYIIIIIWRTSFRIFSTL